jgi:hypothetical protein
MLDRTATTLLRNKTVSPPFFCSCEDPPPPGLTRASCASFGCPSEAESEIPLATPFSFLFSFLFSLFSFFISYSSSTNSTAIRWRHPHCRCPSFRVQSRSGGKLRKHPHLWLFPVPFYNTLRRYPSPFRLSPQPPFRLSTHPLPLSLLATSAPSAAAALLFRLPPFFKSFTVISPSRP